MGDNDAKIFLMIFVFLGAWTGIVGVINMASTGEITLDNIGGMSGTIPGQMIPDTSSFGSLTVPNTNESAQPVYGQDYTTSTGYNESITKQLGGTVIGSMWTRSDGTGYECTNTPIYPLFQPSELGILDVLPEENIYKVTYTIDPAGVSDFYTVVYSVGTANGLFVKYDSNGISLMTLGPLGMSQPLQTLPATGANSANVILSEYNIEQNTLDITIDGNPIGQFTNVPDPSVGQDYPGIMYGGVATYHTGVTVQRIDGLFSSVINLAQNSWIRELQNEWALVANAFGGFVRLIAAAMGLSNQSVLPFGIWAIIGIPCLATLVYLGVKLIRGN